jgi:hypothetical protein
MLVFLVLHTQIARVTEMNLEYLSQPVQLIEAAGAHRKGSYIGSHEADSPWPSSRWDLEEHQTASPSPEQSTGPCADP